MFFFFITYLVSNYCYLNIYDIFQYVNKFTNNEFLQYIYVKNELCSPFAILYWSCFRRYNHIEIFPITITFLYSYCSLFMNYKKILINISAFSFNTLKCGCVKFTRVKILFVPNRYSFNMMI